MVDQTHSLDLMFFPLNVINFLLNICHDTFLALQKEFFLFLRPTDVRVFKDFCLHCSTFNQTNHDTNKPIISVSTTTAWPEFTFIQMWFRWHCNLFSSAHTNARERDLNTIACPWREEYIKAWKTLDFPSHLSCAVVPRGRRRQEMGMTASCLSGLWRRRMRDDLMAEWRCCAFSGFFVTCDLHFPPCCFICDLVLPGQMAIGRLTCPLWSCRTLEQKEVKLKKTS